MATNTIKSSGGDYSSISAWEADLTDPLTADETGELYFEDTSGAAILNVGTSSSAKLILKAAATAAHSGYYSSSAAGISRDEYYAPIRLETSYCVIDGICITQTRSTADGDRAGIRSLTGNGSGELEIKNCIIRRTNLNDGKGLYIAGSSGKTLKISNCIIYDFGDNINLQTQANDVNLFYHNTLYGAASYNYNLTCYGSTDTLRLKNNVGDSAGTSDYRFESTPTTSEYVDNLSSDTTAPGTDAHTSKNPTYENESSDDFRLDTSDTDAIGEGTYLGSDSYYVVDVDLVGTSRDSSTPCIGAFEAETSTDVTATPYSQSLEFMQGAASASGEQNAIATPSKQSLTTSQKAPTVITVQNASIAGSPQALTITQNSPSATAGAITAQSSVALTITQNSATVATTSNVTAAAGLQALTTSPKAPTTTGNASVSPNSYPLAIHFGGATVVTNQSDTATPSKQSVIISQKSASVVTAGNVTATANKISATISQKSPTVVQSITAALAKQALTLSIKQPSVSTVRNATLTVSALTLSITQRTPSVYGTATATNPIETLTAGGRFSTVTGADRASKVNGTDRDFVIS